jgi:hypothetical protein
MVDAMKPVITLKKCCFICANVKEGAEGHHLFSVECTVWNKQMPNQIECEHFELDEERADWEGEIYKSYPEMKDFEFVLED